MWTEQFQALLNLMLMAAMLRLSYDLGRPRIVASNPRGGTNPDQASAPIPGLSPEQAEWADKAVIRYAETQERKWRRLSEVMFVRGT